MAWVKGQPWRVVRSLDRLNAQIRQAYPRAVPPATPVTSWGSIADDAHSSTSDHYPHFYSALGSTAVVCARDFPHAPSLGLDAHALADQLRRSKDPRIGYLISNGRITGPGHDWRWDPYSGRDPHDTHIHVSSVHTARADDASDWQIGEDDMATVRQEDWDAAKWRLEGLAAGREKVYGGPTAGEKLPLVATVNSLGAKVDKALTELAALRATPAVVVSDEQLERVLRRVLGSVDGATPQG